MWLHKGVAVDEESLSEYIGYVYLITNLLDGRMYIGKKLLKFKRTRRRKGKKIKIVIDSDWKTYWGSNKRLQEDVASLGEFNFKREFLRLCKTKGELNYLEAKMQFDLGVLEKPEAYYNEQIYVRVHRSHVKALIQSPS